MKKKKQTAQKYIRGLVLVLVDFTMNLKKLGL